MTRTMLKRLTDERSWQRGEAYYEGGAVYSLLENNDVIHAKVRGQQDYRVRLRFADGACKGECTCPMGDEGVFCKHCVAVGLACIDAGDGPARAGDVRTTSSRPGQCRETARPIATLDDLRRFLSEQANETLVDIVVQQALNDDRLRESLFLRAARQRPEGPDINAFRKAIDNVTRTRGFVDYGSAHGFARGIDEVIDSIAQLQDEGHSTAVIELSERALKRCESALGMIDDSNGEMTGILERIQDIHHAACLAARPDPEALARRLFEWEMTTDWDTFYGAAQTYADVLGENGLAVYRHLAETAWKGVPSLGPGHDRQSFEGSRFRLTSIMESLARVDGDVEGMVAVKRRDLSLPYCYLQIAEIYKKAGEADKALRWAEDGIRAFPNRPDERLREFLADEYHRLKRHAEAIQLIWTSFVEKPDLYHYQALKRHATRASAWSTWRDKALEHIRATSRKRRRESSKHSAFGMGHGDHSTLVEILLWEKKPEAAWEEAQAGGCSNRLWMNLARLREKQHPADAIEIYQRQVEPTIAGMSNEGYREAVTLIDQIGKLMRHVGRGKDFPAYVSSIRDVHRRKRNFIALLDGVRTTP